MEIKKVYSFEWDPSTVLHKKNQHLQQIRVLCLVEQTHLTMSTVQTSTQQEEPLDLIRYQLDECVIVKLRGAREMKGKLQGYDSHCNLVLSEAQEIIYGEKEEDTVIKKTEMVFVRGDSVILISPTEE